MKIVLKQLGRYRKEAWLCIGLTAMEVLMEILMPFVTAIIIDRGLDAANLPVVYRYGAIMVGMAILSLIFGTFCCGSIRRICGESAGVHIRKYPALFLFQH